MKDHDRWTPATAFLLLLCVLHTAPRAAAQISCTVTYNCQGNSGCASVMGGQVTQRTLNYADQKACAAAASAASVGHPLPVISCNCGGTGASADGAASTGSLTGDVLNLGANLWIIQNVKNPYTAVFAQHFSQGFLTGLFGNNSEAQRQQQLAYEAVQRQQQEAAERARIAEQQRIDAMFARLNTQLKLTGSTIQLALKTSGSVDLPMKLSGSSPNSDLKLKLGDAPTAGYGIEGLPGTYVGGPASDAADNSGGLKLKLGDAISPAPATTQVISSMGITGLPGLNLDNVEPSQAAQLADAAAALTGPERSMAEDAALQAAQKNPALTAPSDDPFVADFQKESEGYRVATQQQREALQKASEAEGHVQADKSAIAFANQIVQSPDATEAQKQALHQMQSAAQSDEDAAVSARRLFEQTEVHLSIARERASNALAGLASPPGNSGASMRSPQTAPAAPGGHAAASAQVVASSAVPALNLSSKPQILATPPPGGTPHVMSVRECVASYSPSGSAPTMEELQKKLEGTMTAMERIAKSQETANDLKEDWSKELSDAHKDIFNSVTDSALDGLLDLTTKSLEKDKELYHEALEASMKESQELRWEHQATAAFGAPNASVEGKIADYKARAQTLLQQRQIIEDDMAGVEKAQSVLEKFQTKRDFRLWLTDNELIPCKFDNDGRINCDEFKKNNGVTKFAQGDLNTQLDLLKQLVKFGMHYSPAFKALSHSSLIGETWDITSFAIDTAYDGLAIAYSKQRLDQVKQNDVQLERATRVLGDRIDRLNAEIGCYQRK